MSCQVPTQDKLRRLLFAPETDCAVNVADFSTYLALLAFDSRPQANRGTGRQVRTGIQDGYGGERRAVDGSRGWSVNWSQEIYVGENLQTDPLWQLLLACGLQAEIDETAGTVNMRPADGVLSDFTVDFPEDTVNPIAVSLAEIFREGSVRRIRGATGNLQLQMTTGERAIMTMEMIGLIVNNELVSESETPYSTGDFNNLPAPSGLPLVAKGCELFFEDEGPDDQPLALSEFSFNANAQTPDTADARDDEGLGVTQPHFDGGPEVSFTVAETAQNRVAAMRRIMSQEPFRISYKLVGPGGRSFELEIPHAQCPERELTEQDGKLAHQVTAIGTKTEDGDKNDSFWIRLDYGE